MNTEDTHDVVEIKKDNELSTENITVQTKVLTVKQDRTYNSYFHIMINTNINTHEMDEKLPKYIELMKKSIVELYLRIPCKSF